MNITVYVEDFGPQFFAAIAKKLNRALEKAKEPIRKGVGLAVEDAIHKSPEYFSILSGRLWHELGVPNPPVALTLILETLKEDVFVEIDPIRVRGGNFDGGMFIGILRGDYFSILNLPSARFMSEGGYVIDWLRWLLTSGPYLINSEYRFVPGTNPRSRTGSGLMGKGGTWGVPAHFSGTFNDNWLTRALAELEEPVSNIIQRELKRAL